MLRFFSPHSGVFLFYEKILLLNFVFMIDIENASFSPVFLIAHLLVILVGVCMVLWAAHKSKSF